MAINNVWWWYAEQNEMNKQNKIYPILILMFFIKQFEKCRFKNENVLSENDGDLSWREKRDV